MARVRIPIVDGAADTAQIAAFERYRRELIRRGMGLGGVAIVASSIPLLLAVRNAFAADSGDAQILASAIDLERIAVLAYTMAIDGGLLAPRLERAARRFRDHEQQHADVLVTALTDLGGSVPAKPSAKEVDEVAAGIAAARSEREVANVAIELELAAIAAYHDAHSRLVDAKLLQTGASIMANEAQHLVVLRQAVDRAPVPFAFQTGKDS